MFTYKAISKTLNQADQDSYRWQYNGILKQVRMTWEGGTIYRQII